MRRRDSADPEHPPLHKVPLGGEEWCCIGTCWMFYICRFGREINSFLFASLEFNLQYDTQVLQVAFG